MTDTIEVIEVGVPGPPGPQGPPGPPGSGGGGGGVDSEVLDAEIAAREAGDAAEATARASAIAAEATARANAIAAETTARQNADTAAATALAAEATARAAADTAASDALQAGLDDEAVARANAINTEATARAAADTAAAGSLSTEAAARAAGDALLQPLAARNQPNGYAGLDGAGRVPASMLPVSAMEYQGVWNAATNTPTIADGAGNAGDVFRVSVAGTRNLGSGAIDFQVGDLAIYDGSVWQKGDTTDAVSSVAGRTGAVVVVKGDVGLGNADNTSDVNKPVSTAQQAAIDGEAGARSAADAALSAADVAEAAARSSADTAEASARASAISDETAARISAVNAEASTRGAADTAEATARANADTTETAARVAGDSTEAAARVAGDAAEATARTNADTALQTTMDVRTSRVTVKLSADIGPVVSPLPVKVLSGSFVPDDSKVTVRSIVGASYAEGASSNGILAFTIAKASDQPTTTQRLTQAALPSGVTELLAGAFSSLGGTEDAVMDEEITGLTIGTQYNWDLTVAIVGYATQVPLPDTPIAVATSKVGSVANANYPEIGDCTVAVVSATKLHVIRSNHLGSVLKDNLMTGTGKPLTSGRTSGYCAVTPDGKRVLVCNYVSNTVSLFDVSTLARMAQPQQIGADLAVQAAPLEVVISPDGASAWIADALAVTGHVQKLSNVGSGTLSTNAAIQLTDAGGAGMGVGVLAIALTPDGSKLVAVGQTSRVWIINTATNAVTGITLPASAISSATVACASNSKAYFIGSGPGNTGNPSLYVIDLNAGTVTLAAQPADLEWQFPQVLRAFPDFAKNYPLVDTTHDAASLLLGINGAGLGSHAIRHIMLKPSSVTPHEYTAWANPTASGSGDEQVRCLAINSRGSIFMGAVNVLSVFFGGRFDCDPATAAGFSGHRAQVSVSRAH